MKGDMDTIYPPNFVDELHEAIENHDRTDQGAFAEENTSNRNRYRPIPSRDDLRSLLDVALAASQQPEEGRLPQFALAYVPPDGLVDKRYDVCRFQEANSFDATSLAKLAPAAASSRTYLGVASQTPRAGLHIWGLVRKREGYMDTELEEGKHAWTPDPFLLVRVHAPGVLLVYHYGRMHIAYVRGKAYWGLTPASLQPILRDGARIEREAAQAVCEVGSRMAELGKGGALLITEGGARVDSSLLDLTYRFRSPHPALRAALEAYRKGDHRHNLLPPLRAALDFVAELTKVDGAVHLTSDLDVVGFGGKVMRGFSTDVKLTKADPRQLDIIEAASLDDYRGMRHRSAAQFCANHPGLALALVVSQDGDVTLVGRRDDGSVHKIGPFALGIGVAT